MILVGSLIDMLRTELELYILAADPALHQGWWGPWKEKPNNWPRDGAVTNDVKMHETIAFENDVV